MKKELNKWQFVWDLSEALEYRDLFTRRLTIGVVKLTSFPQEGVRISKQNYDGYMGTFIFWVPFKRQK